jgi:hypothetical protein
MLAGSHDPHPTTRELDGVSCQHILGKVFRKILNPNNKVDTLASKTLTQLLTSIVEVGRWARPQALKI